MKYKKTTTSLIVTTYNRKDALALVLDSVLQQTQLPDEVIIADDGSTPDTAMLIAQFQARYPVPLHHSWQEDIGFRLAASRNKAIARASADYIIIIDGDMLLDKRFIADHLRYATPRRYAQGSRVLLRQTFSEKLLRTKRFIIPSTFSYAIKNRLNGLHIPLLTKLITQRTTQQLKGVRGCNFSLFKDDILSVNGFNEDFVGWGKEDSEFVDRLYKRRVYRINLKFAAIQYHLYHPSGSANSSNIALLEETINADNAWCVNGIDKHITRNLEM